MECDSGAQQHFLGESIWYVLVSRLIEIISADEIRGMPATSSARQKKLGSEGMA